MKLKLKRNSNKRIKNGHLWVFSNELEEIHKLQAGVLVEVIDEEKSYGMGFYNPNSLIAVRLLNTFEEPTLDFFKSRIQRALELRKAIYPNARIYRLVFGESDFLPGLIIDKYENYFSCQYLSAGMDLRKDLIIEALLSLFPATEGIIEKNDSILRQYEGLTKYESIVYGSIPDEIETVEYDIKLIISLITGQKTGYYLDQKDNRLLIRKIVDGCSVLDCFTNQGGFPLNAAYAGASAIKAIDSSDEALKKARKNAAINGFDINFENAEVMNYLQNMEEKYDIIILDPPAFAKSKKALPTALKGYAKLNRLALNKINEKGYLVSSSCSGLVTEQVFFDIINKEAAKMGRKLNLILRGSQAADHPIYTPMPETNYLKFMIFKVD